MQYSLFKRDINLEETQDGNFTHELLFTVDKANTITK
jgi:hypothetical protein